MKIENIALEKVLILIGKSIQKECQVDILRLSITRVKRDIFKIKNKANQKLAITRNKLNRGRITRKIENFFLFFFPLGSIS